MQIVTPSPVRERIGFVVPRWVSDPIPYGCQGLPFRALSVASALFNAGYEVVFFDQEHDMDRANRLPLLRDALQGVRIVFVWMSEMTPMLQTQNMLAIARLLKEWYPNIAVATGGSFITICPPEALFVDWPVDYFVRGYGEEAAPALVAALDESEGLDGVSGLVWRNGTHRFNEMVPHQRFRPEHLSLYRLLDLRPYVQRGGIFGNDQGTFVIGTARGCAKGCTFCYWSNHEPSLLDAATIVDLVAFLRQKYGVRQFHLAELDFFTARRRPIDLARVWRERVSDCSWFTLASPVDAMKLSDEEWGLLVAGGCRKIELGAETGSAAMLSAIGKKHAPDDPLVLAKRMLAHGITPMINFVFGLVGETADDRRASLDLIRRLHELAPGVIHFTFRFFQPAWNTPMGDAAIAHAPDYPKTIEDVLTFRPRFGDAEQHEMGWITSEDERFIKKIVYHYLPLATSKLVFQSPAKQQIYSGLRSLSRVRLEAKFFDVGADRWLYEHILGHPLDNTYVQ
ncbi:MAG: B12-binding domain-containing radical SAM protein [Planctomycetes bacterium]|nr:B12-binding domain-containing radical SAM protein [Planctomycetota bacterium]MBI3846452.1 B12-binding domain-containing radical SAM protein [Planctomycetota bacterium]